MISIDMLFIIGLIFFLKLPSEKRFKHKYWVPFLIVALTALYENFGAYLRYEVTLNQKVNILLGNDVNLNYNVWLYNFANFQLVTVLFLFLIAQYLPKKKRRMVIRLTLFFIFLCIVLQLTRIQPLYDSQPLLFAVGAGSVLAACGLYFLSFMKEDIYLETNPLRLISFWQATFLLFYFSLIFLKTISEKYLWERNISFAITLSYINTIMWILIMGILVLTIAAPSTKWKIENQPKYV